MRAPSLDLLVSPTWTPSVWMPLLSSEPSPSALYAGRHAPSGFWRLPTAYLASAPRCSRSTGAACRRSWRLAACWMETRRPSLRAASPPLAIMTVEAHRSLPTQRRVSTALATRGSLPRLPLPARRQHCPCTSCRRQGRRLHPTVSLRLPARRLQTCQHLPARRHRRLRPRSRQSLHHNQRRPRLRR